MPKYGPKLFDTNVDKLVWGVTPGGHVAHLIDPKNTTNFLEISSETRDADKFDAANNNYSVNKVSQDMVYNNAGDNQNAIHFKEIAKRAEELYEAPYVPDEYKAAMIALKEYLFASGRAEQQEKLRKYKEMAAGIIGANKNSDYMLAFRELTSDVVSPTSGSLIPEKHYFYNKNKIEEPSNRIIGKFGTWVKSDDVLFSHMPSPNDVKQGYGVNDCFLLSPLVHLAEKHPEKIKAMMKDNLDGTVTGRFFLTDPNTHEKKAVYVTVNKTTNKLVGKADVYASSALWVQMAEKLYIKFRNEYGTKQNSFSAINYDSSANFLNAIDNEHYYEDERGAFGFSNHRTVDDYRPNSTRKRPYNNYEKELFSFFKKHVNDKKEAIMVGANEQDSTIQKKVDDSNSFAKSHGVRTQHVYAILGAFEKNGKMYLQVRDPRGLFRSRYDNNGNLVNDSSRIMGTFKGGVSNMGTFNLEIKDFNKMFDTFIAIEKESKDEFDALSDKWDKEYEERIQKKEAEKKASENKGFSFDDFEELDYPEGVKSNEKASENVSENIEDEYEVIDIEEPMKSVKNVSLKDNFGFEDLSDEDFEMDKDVKAPVKKEEAKETRAINENILNILNEPGGVKNMKAYIDTVSDDLETTAMFFKYKNTQAFRDMRNKLTAIQKDLKDPKKEVNVNKLAADLTELSSLATTYADQKVISIETNIRENHKDPSLRAIHRLSDAVMLSRLSEGVMEYIGSDNGFAESLEIIRSDIDERRRDLTKKDMSKDEKAIVTRLDNTSKIIDNYLEKNPALKEKAIRLNAHREVQKEVKKQEIKAPKIDALRI